MTLTGLRARLADGVKTLALLVTIDSPILVELAAVAGYDAVLLDCEHGPIVESRIGAMVLAGRAAGVRVLVRTRRADSSLIGAALDAGADAVVVPQVTSAEMASAVVAAARFRTPSYPLGARGVNPYVRAANYGGGPDWYEQANSSVASMVMIEGAEGIAALPGILAVESLDAIMIGPYDLSQSLGRPGEVEHPRVLAAVAEVIATAAATGRASVVFAPTAAAARRWFDAGAALVVLGSDTALAVAGMRAAVQAVRASEKAVRETATQVDPD